MKAYKENSRSSTESSKREFKSESNANFTLPTNPENSQNKNSTRQSLLVDLKSSLPKMNRGLRKLILAKNPDFKRLFHCTSKYQLRNILSGLSMKNKNLLREYMRKCFIFHLHVRPISNISELLKQRRVIYESIGNPDVLCGNKSFANNLIKNFCKGVVNFIVLFYRDLVSRNLLDHVQFESSGFSGEI